MAIQFTCPSCGTTTQADEQFAGQTGPCRTCGTKVTIPIPSGIAAPQPKSSAGSTVMVIVILSVIGLFACVGVAVAVLVPAVHAAREAARRMRCSNNMKQVALALHNYHDTYKSFPPAYTVDENGEPLHSWRTLILPFLEQQGVYSQIDLTEPWNSPKNQAFNRMMIPTYHCPNSPNPSDCSYVAIVGPKCVFQPANGINIAKIADGTSNTIMLVEVKNHAHSWMEPVDLDASKLKYAINAGSTEPGSFHSGGLNVGMADGSVRFFSQTVDSRSFEALTTIDGNERVPVP